MKKKDIIIGSSIIVGLLVLDQISKIIIHNTMELYQTIPIINGFFHITYVVNTGAAWSIFAGSRVFLLIVSVIAMIFFMFLYKDISFVNKKFYSISLSMMISGALGNFIDRLFIGHVRDFIDFFGNAFPVFNIADMCLTIGLTLFAIDILFFENRKGKDDGNN